MSDESLEDYAKARKRTCPLCDIDDNIRTEMHAGYKNGVNYAVIRGWLKDKHDTDIAYAPVKNHFTGGHHLRGE